MNLKPFGFITLFVNQEDQDRAKRIVRQWDTKEYIDFVTNDNSTSLLTHNPPPIKSIKFKYFFLIILIYIILSGVFYVPNNSDLNCFHCAAPFVYDVVDTFLELFNEI